MTKTYTQDQLDQWAEERDRQKGLDEELAAITPQDAINEDRRLRNLDAAND